MIHEIARAPRTLDFAVIGAGIAGASAAWALAEHGSVVLLEREERAGYHSTGRSAAIFCGSYGNVPVRALSRATRGFLVDPPAGFEPALVRPRPSLYIASRGERAEFDALVGAADIADIIRATDAREALRLVPILREESANFCALEADSMDIDVNGLHQGFLRGLKARGAAMVRNAGVTRIEHGAGTWIIEAGDVEYRARIVINAAGAWADEVAILAGAEPIGLTPKRRTAALLPVSPSLGIDAWPIVINVAESFYFKPEAGQLLLSPADETASPACDVQPDDIDIAVAVERFERATTMAVTRINRSWAGLRSFVADRTPVVGFDMARPGFFWLAGQGGYGVQTCAALARLTAALAVGKPPPDDLADAGVRAADLAPQRLRAAA